MAGTYEIFTYGGGEALREVFNAIASAMGTDTYSSLIKLAVLLAGTWVMSVAIMRRRLDLSFRWIGTYYLAFYLLFLPKVSVHITDRIEQAHHNSVSTTPISSTVDNVPLGLAVFASLTSQVGDALTQLTEQTFSLPEDLRYGRSGMVMASNLVEAASSFRIVDPTFSNNVQAFVKRCVFYDVLLGKYTQDALFQSTDVWSFVKRYASPARSFMYTRPSGQSSIVSCEAGAQAIDATWASAIEHSATLYGAQLFAAFGRGIRDENARGQALKTMLLSYLPTSYGYLTQVSESATSLLRQNMMLNAVDDALINGAASLNAGGAVTAYAFNKAQQQKRLSYATLGKMASHWLSLMKNVFEAILYAIFLIIAALTFFPFGANVLKSYVFSLLWIQLWAPLYAILNLLVTLYAQDKSGAAISLVSHANGLAMLTQSNLMQVNADMSALAGYLSLSIPFISLGVVRGMATTFTSLAQYIGGTTQSIVNTASAEAASGNLSMGNTQFSNQSAFNQSAYHVNQQGQVMSGGFSRHLAGGSIATLMPGGGSALNTTPAISQLGSQVHLSDTLRTYYQEQSDTSWQNASSEANEAVDSTSAAMRQVYNYAETHAHDSALGQSTSHSHNDAFSTSANELKQEVNQFADEVGLSKEEAMQRLSERYVDVSAKADASAKVKLFGTGVSAGAQIKGGYKKENQTIKREEQRVSHQGTQQFTEQTHINKVFDNSLRASKEKSFRESSSENERFSQDLASTFDTTKTHIEKASASYSEAENYRELASYMQEKSALVDTNASQAFYDWLKEQPAPFSTQGRLGDSGVEGLIHEPALLQSYANQFVQAQSEKTLKSWFAEQGAFKQEPVKQHYDDAQRAMKREAPETFNQNNNQGVAGEMEKGGHALEERFSKENMMDENKKVSAKVEHKLLETEAPLEEKSYWKHSYYDSVRKSMKEKK